MAIALRGGKLERGRRDVGDWILVARGSVLTWAPRSATDVLVPLERSGDGARWLRRFLAAPSTPRTLRRVVTELDARELVTWSDGDVFAFVARALDRGRIGAAVAPLVDLGHLERTEETSPEVANITTKTWIEVVLLDESDRPVPNRRYCVALPNGELREGTLDGRGRARITQIDPGTCQVSFPDLDAEAYRRVS